MMGSVPVANVKLTGEWAKLRTLLEPAPAMGRIKQFINQATAINGSLVRKKARQVIKDGMSPTNAALTLMIKAPKTKPLVDYGELFKAITSTSVAWNTAEIGVRKGNEQANTAALIHQGGSIPVTNKMRGMFLNLWFASKGTIDPGSLTGRAAELWARKPGGWKPLKRTTTHIKIPARPFLKIAMEDGDLLQKIAKNWADAFSAGLADKPYTPTR